MNRTLLEKGIVLRKLKNITPPTRKKIEVFLGTDIDDFYYLFVILDRKSRFLQKDIDDLELFLHFILNEINFRKGYKILFLKAPICNKAKLKLKEKGWKNYDFV